MILVLYINIIDHSNNIYTIRMNINKQSKYCVLMQSVIFICKTYHGSCRYSSVILLTRMNVKKNDS